MLTRTRSMRLGIALTLVLLLGAALGLGKGVAYADDGDLDTSFGGGDGPVTTNFHNTLDEARAMAIQPDGKIVAVGTTHISGTDYNFSVARYNPDGSPDTTFSGDGRLTTNFWCTGYCESDDGAYAVAIQPDGKIVAAGTAEFRDAFSFAVARYNPDGSLDGSFGPGPYGVYGIEEVWFGDGLTNVSVAHGVAIQDDGKIVLAGRSTFGGGSTNFAVARLHPNGSLDTSFDGDGKLTTNFFGGVDEAHAVAMHGGSVVVAGFAQVSGFNYDFALARYNPNGSLDTTFGGDGKVTTDFFGGDDGALSMALQSDGKIVAAGAFYSTGQGYDFGLARYLSNGDLDSSFDSDGLVDINFVAGTATEVANGVAVQPTDGKIVAVGYAPVGGINDFALVRLNPDGSLDGSFGGGDGKVNHDFGGGVAIAYGVAIQSDGRIVTAGTAYMGDTNHYDYALARYLSGAAPPPPPPPPPASTSTPRPADATPTPKPTTPPTKTPAPPPANSRYFPETKQTVRGLFLQYWETHGGLAQQGYPISAEMPERSDTDGKMYTMQYFERAVFEYHPENPPPYNVLLSLLGTFYYNEKYSGNAPNQRANPDNPRRFPETGKTIGGAFRKYWETHGGLAQQGYPISEEFQEVSPVNGKTYTVQYFQRAVFEYHPENVGTPYDVLLSLLGSFYYNRKHGVIPQPTVPPPR